MNRSTIRTYIESCASGNINKLTELLSSDPLLIKYNNTQSEKSGLYYAIRNLRYNTTKYLLYKGLFIDHKTIRFFVYDFRGSSESYLFFKKFGTTLYKIDEYPDPYDEWLFETYIDNCLIMHNITKIFDILKIENKMDDDNLKIILNRYKSGSSVSFNKNYKSNVRELMLNMLV